MGYLAGHDDAVLEIAAALGISEKYIKGQLGS